MVTVRRGNVLLDVKEDAVQRMLDMGYDVLDECGNVATASVPKDVAVLTEMYHKHVAEIKALKEELASLKAAKTNVAEEDVAPKRTKKK